MPERPRILTLTDPLAPIAPPPTYVVSFVGNRTCVDREGLTRDIIKRRWLDDENKATLQELADEYGVSAERVRQIEANALKKMKALFAA